MNDTIIERSRQLIDLKRYSEAETQLMHVLAGEPNNVEALILISICKSRQGEHKEAKSFIKSVISLQPDSDHALFLYALYSFQNDDLNEGQKHVNSAISFNPHEAEYFGLLALILAQKKDWDGSLNAANQGLAVNAENLTCLNARSTALFKLNKKDDAFTTIAEALNQDPENDDTHTNLGWGVLEKGSPTKALEHFREALKINPQNQNAKAGLVEALKARYWIYRIFLKYAFWVSNFNKRGQWFVLIGMYLGFRVLRSIAETNPSLAPFLLPLVYLYFSFAISTWVITPVGNLFLRFNIYGRYALTEDEINSSNFVAFSLGLAVIGVFLFIFNNIFGLPLIVFGIGMMIPLSSMYNPFKSNHRRILIGYTMLLAVLATLEITLIALSGQESLLGIIFVFGVFAYQWLANAFIIR